MSRERDGTIAYLDAKIAADKEAKQRRAEAGEMGIELAKKIVEGGETVYGPLLLGYSKAIMDKLEGR